MAAAGLRSAGSKTGQPVPRPRLCTGWADCRSGTAADWRSWPGDVAGRGGLAVQSSPALETGRDVLVRCGPAKPTIGQQGFQGVAGPAVLQGRLRCPCLDAGQPARQDVWIASAGVGWNRPKMMTMTNGVNPKSGRRTNAELRCAVTKPDRRPTVPGADVCGSGPGAPRRPDRRRSPIRSAVCGDLLGLACLAGRARASGAVPTPLRSR